MTDCVPLLPSTHPRLSRIDQFEIVAESRLPRMKGKAFKFHIVAETAIEVVSLCIYLGG